MPTETDSLLDQTINELQRTLALLEEREVGLFTWHEAVQGRLRRLGAYLKANGWVEG